MPIYTYDCPTDGVHDVFIRAVGPPFEMECPTCRSPMVNVIAAPARVEVQRDWNEKANDFQTHGEYHQAKSQLQNIKRTQADRGEPNTPITEEAIQVAAKAIHEGKVNPPPSPEQRNTQHIRKFQREHRQKQTD